MKVEAKGLSLVAIEGSNNRVNVARFGQDIIKKKAIDPTWLVVDQGERTTTSN